MRVLLATDFSSGAAVASVWLTHASWPPGTQVEVLHVSPAQRAGVLGLLWKARTAEANEQVSAAASLLARRLGGHVSVMSSTRVGDPGTAIVERAAEIRADLVVLGSRGRGHFAGHLVGSVSAAVATNASCSVLVARREAVRSLLLADDGSGSAQAAAQTLLAWSFLAPIPTAVTAIVDAGTQPGPTPSSTAPSAERRAADAVEQRVAEFQAVGRMAIGRVVQGDASVEILRAARTAGTDMIVVGVGNDRGDERPLGRVARSVLWGFRGSVLIARADHAISEYPVDAGTWSASASSVSQASH
jgi:nucleotide-binding universal stress UspA family protein